MYISIVSCIVIIKRVGYIKRRKKKKEINLCDFPLCRYAKIHSLSFKIFLGV